MKVLSGYLSVNAATVLLQMDERFVSHLLARLFFVSSREPDSPELSNRPEDVHLSLMFTS